MAKAVEADWVVTEAAREEVVMATPGTTEVVASEAALGAVVVQGGTLAQAVDAMELSGRAGPAR